MTLLADPSTRFILPADSVYVRNLAALWAVDPALAGRIELLDEDARYPTEPSKAGDPTIRVPAAGGVSLYLHSRHQPIAEASRLIDAVAIDDCLAFYIHGMGLGYHLEALFDRAADEAFICVLEPDLLVIKTALLHRDFSRLIASRRVLFFTQLEKNDIVLRLQPLGAILSMGFTPITHAPSVQREPAFHEQMAAWIAEYQAFLHTSFHTLITNGRRTAENIARNLAWYVATPGVDRLKDRYRGHPAVIVSAGPSLRKNKHLLKNLEERAAIIAVQTTLQPLLEMGVEPHFVTSLDYHDICTRFFEKLPPTLRTELVAEPKATDRIFEMNPGPLTILGNSFAEHLLAEMKLNKGTLTAGATVAHLAYYLAEHLGCDPIIFVGQDLGFSDGLCYAPGTSYDDVWRPELGPFCSVEMKQWEQIVRDRPILRRIPDIEGRPMYTEERLFTYLQQFERDFAQCDRRIIDATEGGALKRGATPMTLKDAIDQFCTRPLAAAADDYPGLQWSRLDGCTVSLRRRRDEAANIERISTATLPLLEEVRDHLDDQSRVNRAIARIDALRADMNAYGLCYDLIVQLTQLTELNRFQQDRKISAAKVEGIERQRRQVNRDIDNVRGIADAARVFQRLMDEVIEKVSVMSARHQREAA